MMAARLVSAFPDSISSRLRKTGVVAVLVIDDAEKAVPLAKILVASGVDIMELAMRTPASFDALERIAAEVPEMLAGVGTIIRPDQVCEARNRGASFIVTPGTNRAVIEKACRLGIPIAPGVAVPSDIETALEYDCRILKFFPAEPLGGLGYLKAMNAPYAHLGIEYIPLGGISEANCRAYITQAPVIAVGGSWIAPRDQIKAGDWEKIGATAARAVTLCRREAPLA
jgi:2-dehydro-3-deoxyphosphogluconate aldolase/(4S)-4-hydroxy-2-oxoglutarate aldolase